MVYVVPKVMMPGEANTVVPTECTLAAEEERILCIVRDMTSTETQMRFSLNIPASCSAGSLIEDVGKRLGYDPHSFLLVYEMFPDGVLKEVELNRNMEAKLSEICIISGVSRKHNFNVLEKDGPPIRAMATDSAESYPEVKVSEGTYDGAGASGYSPATIHSPALPLSYSTDYSYSSSHFKSDTGYVGLVNQAMTCYLNSLLQTLFMTPEFRNAVYRYESDTESTNVERNIPFQLQKLFLHLQTSKRRAVETTDITKSFGWDSSESWQQHDIQELFRVMFDALERKWKDTDQANLINQLYQGNMKDYVKCLGCGYESARNDSYLDIPLTIRPFGSTQSYTSVMEALDAFVQPEILDGNNQYMCGNCKTKCNAHKGLKFLSFPYLLTLQLKRFDFDYSTMHRIKLNDRLEFPEILDLNHLIDGAKGSEQNCDDGDVDAGASTGCKQDLPNDEGVDEGIDLGYSASGASVSADAATSSLDVKSSNDYLDSEAETNCKNDKASKAQGPYEYELFSIMIHSGSAAGGHYYAYIKSFKDGQWYSFNDQNVSTITYDDIQKTFGGSLGNRSYYSSTFTSSTNAYMLMYRQINKAKNADFANEEDFPEHLRQVLQKINSDDENERRQKELERCTCKIKLFNFHPKHKKQVETKLEVHKNKTLSEATEIAWKQLELEDIVPLDCVRLVRYDDMHEWIEKSYEGEENTTMGELLGGVKTFYTFELLLEVKQPDEEFEEYKTGGVTVKVHLVDLQNETISEPVTVRAYTNETLNDFKQIIAKNCDLCTDNMRVVLERYSGELRLLSVPTKSLKDEGFLKSNKVFVECSGLEDDGQLIFPKSRFHKLLDRYENTILIFVTLPTQDEVDEMNLRMAEQSIPGKDLDDEGISESDTEQRMSGDDVPASLRLVEAGAGYSDGVGLTRTIRNRPEFSDPVHSYIGQTIHASRIETSSSTPANYSTLEASSLPAKVNLHDDEDDTENPKPETEDWNDDLDEHETPVNQPDADELEFLRYMRMSLKIDTESHKRTLKVWVDKRMQFRTFKGAIQSYVGLEASYYRMYKVLGNGSQEVEITRLSDTFSMFSDESRVTVKVGRALKRGELRVKIYPLDIQNLNESPSSILESIFSKHMYVHECKKQIVMELKQLCNMDVPVERCRLRKKTGRSPGNILINSLKYDENRSSFTNHDLYLQVLNEPEPKSFACQLAVFIRRWQPSTHEFGPMQEVILSESTMTELKSAISKISDIAVENIEIAKARGIFPYEISPLEIQDDLDWNTNVESIRLWPLHIYEDGNVVFYRDKNESVGELSDAQRAEIQKQNRISSISTRNTYYSPRKEKALKIYTDDPPATTTTSSTSG